MSEAYEAKWYSSQQEIEAFFDWMKDNDFDSSDLIAMIQNPHLYDDIHTEFRNDNPLEGG